MASPPTSPTRSSHAARLRSGALRVFLALIVLNAAIAIGAIFGLGSDDGTQWDILATSSTLTAVSLTFAANTAAVARGRLGLVPFVAAGLCCIAAGLTITGIWADSLHDAENFWKFVGVAATSGIGGTLMSMLAMPRLRPPWQLAQLIGHASTLTLIGLITTAILREDGGPIEPYGVASVICAAATLLVLVGARVAGVDGTTRPLSEPGYCPLCGAELDEMAGSGPTSCGACGSVFEVRLLEAGPPHAPDGALDRSDAVQTDRRDTGLSLGP